MEFRRKRNHLNIEKDLLIAAKLLSKLHSFDTTNAPLLVAKSLFGNV